jgi:hypothetical protein
MRWLVALAALLAAACSTQYQDMGFTGGVASQQMTANTFRIIARGNGYTNQTTIQDYMILKAAETTKQAGGTHFMIINSADSSSVGTVVTPGQARTSVVGNTAYTTYSPATAHNFIRPGQDAYIRVFAIAPGAAPPLGAFSADEIITFVGSRVKRG